MFDCAWILNPPAQIFTGILCSTRCDRGATHQVRQVRAEASIRRCSGDRVAVHASVGLEDALAFLSTCGLKCRLLLRANPLGEFLWRVHRYAQEHLCVLNTAVLR